MQRGGATFRRPRGTRDRDRTEAMTGNAWRGGALAAALAVGAALAHGACAQERALVTLRILPRAGNTLRTRFEQEIEQRGVTKVRGVDTTITSHTSVLVLARVVVETSDSAGCTLTVITDSVATTSVGMLDLPAGEAARRAMQGRRIALRLRPDGSAEFVDAGASRDPEVGALVGAMPAVLPPHAVAVGATWESAMALPMDPEPEAAHGARLRATYRLDSLAAGGARAFIGLRGAIARDSADGPIRSGGRMRSRGAVSGSLVLDRRFGWWSDSRLIITLASTVSPPPGAEAPPVRVETRITQHMRTEPLRARSLSP
jgi:hypothetical protein